MSRQASPAYSPPPIHRTPANAWRWALVAVVAVGMLPGWVGLFTGKPPEVRVTMPEAGKREVGRLAELEHSDGTVVYSWQIGDQGHTESSIADLGKHITGQAAGWPQIYHHLGQKGWRLVTIAQTDLGKGSKLKEVIFER